MAINGHVESNGHMAAAALAGTLSDPGGRRHVAIGTHVAYNRHWPLVLVVSLAYVCNGHPQSNG